MANNICPNCKTENEPEYEFCKNCGKPLYTESKPTADNIYVKNNEQSYEEEGKITVDGNTVDEVSVFVGKNANKIVPGFINIERTGSKVRWCWPPFILGILFGPLGVAMWFLYRKIYSFAAIFGGIAVIINYISFAFDRFLGIGEATLDTAEKYFESFIDFGKFDYEGFIEAVTDGKFQTSAFLSSLYSAIGVTCAVLSGIFAIYIYKRHTAKKIFYVKSLQGGSNYLLVSIAAKGGTSVGSAILGTIIISFVSNLPETVYSIINITKVVIGL